MLNLASLQRIRKAIKLQEPDVVPVAPYMGNHGAKVGGVPIDRYCQSGKLMADAQYRAWEVYQQDALVLQSDNYYIAEGFGITVEHHPDSTPTLKKPAIENLSDIYRLQVPDPRKDGRMPVYLEAAEILAVRMRDSGAALRLPGTGPFSLASHLIGTERFLMEVAKANQSPGGDAEQALMCLMELTTAALASFTKACFDAGAHLTTVGDSLASPDVISPAMYRKWVFPFEKKFFREVNLYAEKYQGVAILHICGNTIQILEWMADTGAPVLEIDSKVSMKTAKEKVGHRVCLMGNIHPTEVLLQGTVADVRDAANQVIADAGRGGGLILGSGCEVPIYAPQENIKEMVRVARSHHYPLAG